MKIRPMLLSLSAIILLPGLLAVASATQQSKERLIQRLPVEANEPIAITDIKVNDRSVSFDKKFSGDDEWLRSLVISVKNTSDKLILFASIRLQFPRSAGGSERFSIFQISHGNAALPMRPPTHEERVVGIGPDETVEIRLSPQRFTDLRDFLSATQYPYSIEKVGLSIDEVIFQDDTMWYAGAISVRNPKEPGSWINSLYANRKPQ